jgi:hypothetical protein
MADTEDSLKTETTDDKTLGTEADKNVEDTGSDKDTGKDSEEYVSKADYDKLAAKIEELSNDTNRTKQERNMLRNKLRKMEGKTLEVDDVDTLKDTLRELLEEKETREKADEEASSRKEAEAFRDKVISEYPEAVQKAAKRLIAKNSNNLIWEDATDWNDARAQLVPQLDALKEALGEGVEDDNIQIHANNPGGRSKYKSDLDRFQDLSLEDMEKELEVAPAR